MTQGLNVQADLSAARPAESPRSGTAATRWVLLSLLTIGVMIAFVDRTSISSAIADKQFVRHFAMTDIDRGIVNSAFFWTYGLFQLVMGSIVDRYGVKWPYAIFFLLWCLATAATGFAGTFAVLIAMRLIIGAAESVATPASFRWIRNNFEERNCGTAIGIFTAGNKLGSAIGAPVAAWLIVQYNWQAMFVVLGTVGLIWLVPWLVMLPNDLPGRDQMTAARRTSSTISYADIFASPVVWGGLIINFCYGYFTFFCATWMPAYLVEQHGLSLEESGLYTFFSFAGVAVVAIFGGWAADVIIARGHDKIAVRKGFIVAGFIGGCTVLLGAWAHSLPVALFWNIVSLSLLGLTTANMHALCRLTLIPSPAVGRVTGVQQVATSLSGGITATLSGWLLHISGGYDLPMMVIFFFLIVGAATTLILMQPKWAPRLKDA